jgi:hypothetical protein
MSGSGAVVGAIGPIPEAGKTLLLIAVAPLVKRLAADAIASAGGCDSAFALTFLENLQAPVLQSLLFVFYHEISSQYRVLA